MCLSLYQEYLPYRLNPQKQKSSSSAVSLITNSNKFWLLHRKSTSLITNGGDGVVSPLTSHWEGVRSIALRSTGEDIRL